MTSSWIRFNAAAMLATALIAASAAPARAAFDLQFSINSPGSFTAHELQLVNTALGQVEQMWETMITGYQPGINIGTVPITIFPSNSGLASASPTGSVLQGGFSVSISGLVNINTTQIEPFANWQGDEPNGLNFIDELLAHEVGHVLGIGTQWTNNNIYQLNTFQYTGVHGVAAYEAEFSDSLLYVPVENAGASGTPNAHWDQRMRSSFEEGSNGDIDAAFLLDPRVGVTDPWGRDRSFELLTGAIDPDWREPFIARFTVQSLRDMGYTVTEFEDFNGDGSIDVADRGILLGNLGMTGLQINSMCFGDADRDRDVDMADLALWRTAAGVPEPSGGVLAALALAKLFRRRRQSGC